MEIPTKTNIITFNGDLNPITDEIVDKLLEKNFDHFSHVSTAHLKLSSNRKTAEELLKEYASKTDNKIISYPNAYDFFDQSFNVLFLDCKKESSLKDIDTTIYNCVVILHGDNTITEIVERITVYYGYWTLGRTPEKIIV